MLTATDLSKAFASQVLFSDAALQLDAGNRYGIVGANGSGKSTLLRILTEEESPSSGTVTRLKRARMGVLAQDHFAWEQTPIIHVVMMGNQELWTAMAEKEILLANAENEFDDERYAELEETVMRFDGYAVEARAAAILAGLNIPTEVHHQPLSVLSGGYKLRVLLAQTLAAEPDILLLDEPTNHLDILSINWLEGFLQGFKGCSVVVSHDHHFLDRTSTHIIDVDYQRVTVYRGNYEAFLKQKAETRSHMENEINKREREIAEHRQFIARFKAKATKARQANSRAKRVEKIVIESLPTTSRRFPNFKLKARRPSGREVLEVDGIWKSYGDNSVLEEVSFHVGRGDRLAIIGPNGIGKSTLLKILTQDIEADAGTFRWGYEVDLGYCPQDHHGCLTDPKQAVSSFLWDTRPDLPIGTLYGKLAEVLFSREDADKAVENLSGGELTRLLLCRLSIIQPTVLILDEPTNHLDMEAIEALAKGLRAYDGTILFVSHNRWFVQRVASRIIEIGPEGVIDFRGRYSEHVARQQQDHLDAKAVVDQARAQRRKERQQKKMAEQKARARKKAPPEPAEPSPPAQREKRGGAKKSGRKGRNRRRGGRGGRQR